MTWIGALLTGIAASVAAVLLQWILKARNARNIQRAELERLLHEALECATGKLFYSLKALRAHFKQNPKLFNSPLHSGFYGEWLNDPRLDFNRNFFAQDAWPQERMEKLHTDLRKLL